MCTIYEYRPIACREYLMTGSEPICQIDDVNFADVVKVPVRMVRVLTRLASELLETTQTAVLMPNLIAWCEKNRDWHNRTWPAAFLVERFVEAVKLEVEGRQRQPAH